MKITELKLVSTVTNALSIDLTQSKAKLEAAVKEAITSGAARIQPPTNEEAKQYMEWLDSYEVELERTKGELSIPEMEQAQREIQKVAGMFNRIALETYNVEAAELKANKDTVQAISKRVAAFSEVYEESIAAVKAERAAERIEFLKNWTAQELKGRDVYEFAHNWDNYYMQTMTDADGSVNRGKEGNITSPSKSVKETIINKINSFEKDKKAIVAHEYSSVLFDYYIKAHYNLVTALEQVTEYQRLEEKRKAEKAARERADEERRQRAEEEQRKKDEEAAAVTAAKVTTEMGASEKIGVLYSEGLLAGQNGRGLPEATKTEAPKVEVNEESEAEQIRREMYMLQMAEKMDHEAYNKLANQLKAINAETQQEPTKQEQTGLRVFEITEIDPVETKLTSFLQSKTNYKTVTVVHTVEIEQARAEGFKMWLDNNKIDYKER